MIFKNHQTFSVIDNFFVQHVSLERIFALNRLTEIYFISYEWCHSYGLIFVVLAVKLLQKKKKRKLYLYKDLMKEFVLNTFYTFKVNKVLIDFYLIKQKLA